MTETTRHAGGCLCGAVRFQATGAPERVVSCHCVMCRQHTGGPFVVLAVYPPERVAVSGETLDYRSSEQMLRRRCAVCVGQFLIESLSSGAFELYSGCFDDPEPFVPEYEIFARNRPQWLPAFGDIPVYPRFRE